MKPKCCDCGKELYEARAKRCGSCWAKKRFKDKTNCPMFGRHHREETKMKMRIARKYISVLKGIESPHYIDGRSLVKHFCVDCNREISWRNAIYRSGRCKHCGIKGELNCNWKNGKSFEVYPIEFSDALKKSIRIRDNYKCQNCSITEQEHLRIYKQVLHVHHIDYNKRNCHKDNLITVCLQCNLRANANRLHWQKIYKNKIKELLNVR